MTAGAGAGARPATALPDAVPAGVMRVAVAPAAVVPQGVLAVPPGVVPVAAAARDVVPHHGAVRAKAAQAAAARVVPVVTAPVVAGARTEPQAAVPAVATLASPTPSAE